MTGKRLIEQQAVTISSSANEVAIQCDTSEDAQAVSEWLTSGAVDEIDDLKRRHWATFLAANLDSAIRGICNVLYKADKADMAELLPILLSDDTEERESALATIREMMCSDSFQVLKLDETL